MPVLNCKGSPLDLKILDEDQWLGKAVVQHFISQRRGRYWVHITFHNPSYPFQLKIQIIDHYPRQKTAEQFAIIFQRSIRKDARGTFKTNSNAFHICSN